ncbi:tryptophan 2,3-dioxygenase [Rugamonas rivuli]|nr:tryptophan 2,3-dioxygenase family protein [Rugamonas rivuli]
MQECPFAHRPAADATSPPAPAMKYGDYLKLRTILGGQEPLSPVSDEMLFIIQHQSAELWMKLLLHELTQASQLIRARRLSKAGRLLARSRRILDHMVNAWGVLATLEPLEFLAMRPYLGSSSGYQSCQFRELEFLLGNKNRGQMESHAHCPASLQTLRQRLAAPSIYDEVVRLLAARGFDIDPARLLSVADQQATRPDETVEAAWMTIYRAPEEYADLHDLGEQLVDFEDSFRQWRFRHMTTVDRIIGRRGGTGGSSGVPYLAKTLDFVLFPELWRIRSTL